MNAPLERKSSPTPPLVGVNVPWFGQGYGHDLGRNHAYPEWPSYFDRTGARQLLEMLAEKGVGMLRIWLFEDGEGLQVDADGRVTGLDATFHHNLDHLLELLHELGFSVYWTLLDANSVARRNDSLTRSLLVDPQSMRAFCVNAVAQVLPAIRDCAWAIDLCNEPEAVIAGDSGNKTGLGFEWWQIQPALLDLNRTVSTALPSVPVSIGSGFQSARTVAMKVFEQLSLELDFHDFHHHDAEPVAHVGGLATDAPVVLGELGQLVPSEVRASKQAWHEAQRKLLSSLHHASGQGYAAIFLWYASDLQQADGTGLVHLNEQGLVLHSLPDLERIGLIRLGRARLNSVDSRA